MHLNWFLPSVGLLPHAKDIVQERLDINPKTISYDDSLTSSNQNIVFS
jgi:hypothetical protein